MIFDKLIRAREEVQASLDQAKAARDQWLAVSGQNPTNLTKRQIEDIGKTFRNNILSVKWDLEDLEELDANTKPSEANSEQKESIKNFIKETHIEISLLVDQLEQADSELKVLQKHGLHIGPVSETSGQTLATSSSGQPSSFGSSRRAVGSAAHHHTSRKLSELDETGEGEDVLLDKRQLGAVQTRSIVENALHDYYEEFEENGRKLKGFNSSQVFNNLTRPVTNVYVNPNENEMILNMLETEYYNPPNELLSRPTLNYNLRNFFEHDLGKIIKYLVVLFSFPAVLLFFFIM